MSDFSPFAAKMKGEGLSASAISAFEFAYTELCSGSSGCVAESTIEPVPSLPSLSKDIASKVTPNPKLLEETVVLKLNGGLGTSMGLDKAKSLLPVKNGQTFLDLTSKQVIAMRQKFKLGVKFMLMNSFNTSTDTLSFLEAYPTIRNDPTLELVQNKVPKINKTDKKPAVHAANSNLEWCPPGHGDLYAALYGSGKLDELIAGGAKYMFVSNSDNLGATLDVQLLTYFAQGDYPFMMECCERTEADKKGGHLALRATDKQMLLRESAQCSAEDESMFQDVTRHRFFNTNNLWVRLDLLKALMASKGGFVPLPTILNGKTVDPQDGDSTPVWQLETAMGAAIECFKGATAVSVPRSRFAPVKKCSDLLLLRSDAYGVNADSVLELNKTCNGVAPIVDLDSKVFKMVPALDEATTCGYPSLVSCKKLTVKGQVWFCRKNVFVGDCKVINTSDEPKMLPPGVYTNSTIDLSSAPGLGALRPTTVKTKPFSDQKPGTSGVRKKTKRFQEPNYLENFVQATFDALPTYGTDLSDGALLVGGDGRYHNDVAIQTIVKMAAANGIQRVIIGKDGLLSTPAVSAIIRERTPVWKKAFGSFILTASHNPGGPDEDFGIKYNCENGGPAPEKLTGAIFAATTCIKSYKICKNLPAIDITKEGETSYISKDGNVSVVVEVISAVADHVNLLKTVFDFSAIKALIARKDFSMKYDCMNGVQGPYASAVFTDELGCAPGTIINGVPKEDFGGGHADPNLTYAKELVAIMGLDKTGSAINTASEPPCFGAACDGDADRNMILGRKFFVTPSDSLAVVAAHAHLIPFFKRQGGIKAVARSMPTSGAVDLVAKRMNLSLFETPTGWKFFGNVMDSKTTFGGANYNPMICGEESFGTGSNHVREKDGMWAVLAWLQILAYYNRDDSEPFCSVESIVKEHWATYGRNYYCRYDYEGVSSDAAAKVMNHLRSQFSNAAGQKMGSYTVGTMDEFTYLDPIDGSISKNQGIRLLMTDGSRCVFRLSGTAGSGATIRYYIEAYQGDSALHGVKVADALAEMVHIGLNVSQIPQITGMESPTVIT
jgi:phosphoglucomutase